MTRCYIIDKNNLREAARRVYLQTDTEVKTCFKESYGELYVMADRYEDFAAVEKLIESLV